MRDLSFSSGGLKFGYLVTYPEKTKIISPQRIILPLKQDISNELTPIVKKGDTVNYGDIIAKGPDGSLVSPIYGRILEIKTDLRTHLGVSCSAIEIESFEKSILPVSYEDTKESSLLAKIIDAGIIDFDVKPISFFTKLQFAKKNKVTTVIINGLEEIISHGKNYYFLAKKINVIEQGLKLIKKIFGPVKIIITLYNDYKKILPQILNLEDSQNVEIAFLKKKYPQHHPHILVRTILKQDIPVGKAIEETLQTTIINLDTVYQLGILYAGFIPYREKVVTVVKGDINNTELVETVVGASIRDIIEALDIEKEKVAKVVINGCISGQALTTFDYPITKDIGLIYIEYEGNEQKFMDSVCIKCGLCVDVCPMNLMPLFLYGYAQSNVLDFLKKFDINSCIECGCCAYVCPVNIPIPQWIKYGKTNLKNKRSDS